MSIGHQIHSFSLTFDLFLLLYFNVNSYGQDGQLFVIKSYRGSLSLLSTHCFNLLVINNLLFLNR